MNSKQLIIAVIICSLLILVSVSLAADQQNQIELLADKLVVDELNSQVTATGEVVLKRTNSHLTCNQLTANQNLSQATAKGEVVITKQNSRLTGQTLKMDYTTQTGVITGEPEFTRNQTLITGHQFQFNLQTGYLEVTGQAHLEDEAQNLVADADKLQYNRAQQLVTLLGEVQIDRGQRQLEAPKVIINLATNKMTAKGQTRFIMPAKQGDGNGN